MSSKRVMLSGPKQCEQRPLRDYNHRRERLRRAPDPQRPGGQAKSVRLPVPRLCNSRTGDTWDAALADQFPPLCLLVDVARERGEPPGLRLVTKRRLKIDIPCAFRPLTKRDVIVPHCAARTRAKANEPSEAFRE